MVSVPPDRFPSSFTDCIADFVFQSVLFHLVGIHFTPFFNRGDFLLPIFRPVIKPFPSSLEFFPGFPRSHDPSPIGEFTEDELGFTFILRNLSIT